MKKIIFLIGLLTGNLLFSQTKVEKIRELLNKSGSQKMESQILDHYVEYYKKNYISFLSQDFFDQYKKKIKEEDLTNLIISVYDENFTEKEIDKLVEFSKDSAGKSFLNKMTKAYIQLLDPDKNEISKLDIKVSLKEIIQEEGTPQPPPLPPPPIEPKNKPHKRK